MVEIVSASIPPGVLSCKTFCLLQINLYILDLYYAVVAFKHLTGIQLLVVRPVPESSEVAKIIPYSDLFTDRSFYEGWNFNSGNYLFTTDTK